MNNEKNMHSSLYEVVPIDFPQGVGYISDIEMITMSITGILEAQVSNMTLNESCMMLINAIKVFEMGFFDCAFYSLRQTIELSIGGIYLYSDKKRLHGWNKGERGFEKGRMTQLLKNNDATFSDVIEKLQFYFDDLQKAESKINKYVHKQGVSTFYTYHGHTPNYYQKHKAKLIRDFDTFLKDCIGAVAVYRLIVDPLPLLLTDQNIAMRTPDTITAPFGQSFINKYINERVVEAYKQTAIYQGYYEELSAREKQNEAVYDLIHWQLIDRSFAADYKEQAHLLSAHDKLALIISFASEKVSNCYLMDGFLLYFTDVKSFRKNALTIGNSFFQKYFADERNYNLPFDTVFISRCNAFGETHYFEHNEPLVEQEFALIEQCASELNMKYEKTNEQLKNWHNEQMM